MKHSLWLLLLCCVPFAFAHSELKSAKPGDASILTSLTDAVTLTFSESVEPSFSTFMLRPLADADGVTPTHPRWRATAAQFQAARAHASFLVYAR